MIIEIKIPSPGESITEVQLSAWLVKDGDFVEKDQEMAEIESDKATLPLLASDSGQLKILVQAGENVKVGTIACKIDTSVVKPTNSHQPEAPSAAAKATTQQAAAVSAPAAQETITSKTPEVPKQEPVRNQVEVQTLPPDVKEPETVKISPVAQKMMNEHGLSVDDILQGLKRIGKGEVEAVVEARNQKPSANFTVEEKKRSEERKKMSPLRKKLGERLVAVKNQTAMLTTFNEVDMTAVMDLRKKYQSQFEAKHGIKVGFMSFFVKAVTQALKLHPNVNSMIDGEDMVTPSYYDIAIAVQTDKGLMVPVLRNVESLSLADIEKGIAGLATKARSGRISVEEMSGGTFTITNGGIFGSLMSTPIINPPQSAILGMHNIVERPIAVQGKVEIRPMMYIALSYDHRVIDGKDSVGFLVHVKQFIENPAKMLFEGADPDKLLLGL